MLSELHGWTILQEKEASLLPPVDRLQYDSPVSLFTTCVFIFQSPSRCCLFKSETYGCKYHHRSKMAAPWQLYMSVYGF